jgi:hypothetical protein
MSRVICDWTTYKGNHCKKIISGCNDDKCSKQLHMFCDLHRDLIIEYTRVIEKEELCETFKEIKITPRSLKHIKSIMTSINNDDDTAQVYLAGGSIEDADITNTDFIVLNSDNSRFYYNPKRGQNRAKDLKIILREFCKSNCVIGYNGTKYCEECYKKLKDVPRISLIT